MLYSINSNTNSMKFKVITFLLTLLLVYTFVFNSAATAYAKITGEEIKIFLFSAIVGGAVWDGAKWIIKWATSALTPYGIAAVIATLTIAGVAAYLVYMRNGDEVDRVESSTGCVFRGNQWVCPYRINEPSHIAYKVP